MKLLSRIGKSVACALGALALFAGVGCSHDDPANQLTGLPPNTGFMVREANGHKYSVFIPRDYNPAVKYPTIVFLHGVGEQGGDGITCRTVGLGPEIARRNGNFPFIVVFPQTGGDWTTNDSDRIMTSALFDVEKSYSVDQDRVILTGMSSGGLGTWALGARHPEIFSCLVPMAGWADTNDVPKLVHYPIWCLHNDGDFIVGSGNTKDMVDKLQKAGGNPRVDILPQGGHDCWDDAYSKGDLFQWMMAQHRAGMAAPAAVRVSTPTGASPAAATPIDQYHKQMPEIKG